MVLLHYTFLAVQTTTTMWRWKLQIVEVTKVHIDNLPHIHMLFMLYAVYIYVYMWTSKDYIMKNFSIVSVTV